MRRAAILFFLLGVTACANLKPGNPDDMPTADRIPDGPGLITGDKGKFVLLERKAAPAGQEKKPVATGGS